MTEEEWLIRTHPNPLLDYLRGEASDRKFRLAACAFCRSFWRHMGKASRKAVLLGEQMADEPVDESHREAVVRAAIEAVCRLDETGNDSLDAADLAYRLPCSDGWYAAEWTIGNWSGDPVSGVTIVRDVFGNPFRPVFIHPTWFTPTVTSLATAAYQERSLPSGELDTTRLAVLADALEEASCDDADILNHLRGPGPHVRGCWVVDLCLNKG